MESRSDSPLTPSHERASFTTDMLQRAHDSPLSDYHTDEMRPLPQAQKDFDFTMPSSEAQHFVSRLGEVAAEILRREPEAHDLFQLKHHLKKIESAAGLSAGESHSRMRDSGFVGPGDDSDKSDFEDETMRAPEEDTKVSALAHAVRFSAQGTLLKDAQAILERVTLANANLTARFTEIRDLNDRLIDQAEGHARVEMRLRSENDSLRAGLVHDHSELLFLKLQLKALEIEVHDSFDADSSYDQSSPGSRLARRLDGFKSDWEDVDARLRSRREHFDIRLSGTPLSPFAGREDGKKEDEQGDWALDVCKKQKGRVESIVIRRTKGVDPLKSPYPAPPSSDNDDEQDEDQNSNFEEDNDESDSDTSYTDADEDDDPFVVTTPAIADQPLLCASCERQLTNVDDDLDDGTASVASEPAAPGAWQELLGSLAALTGVRADD